MSRTNCNHSNRWRLTEGSFGGGGEMGGEPTVKGCVCEANGEGEWRVGNEG